MKFFGHLLGITKLDKAKYNSIREKTGAQNIVKEIKQYLQKWLQHVQRMDTDRLPKQALRYRPKVATTCTEGGHRQTAKAGTAL
jgi:RNase adaptor protein for sRNA GlmZ degradation